MKIDAGYALWYEGEMLKEHIEAALHTALERAATDLNNLSLEPAVFDSLKLERPRNRAHGDYAVNVSSLARWAKLAPPQIAEILKRYFTSPGVVSVDVIGGFLNLKLSATFLSETLIGILNTPAPGHNNRYAAEKILLEYVSANPTGPLHIGHGRWAALGDSICRILQHCGATVTPEFYINDAGVQMGNITQSLWRRCLEKIDATRYPFPQKKEDEPYPYYPGEYVIDLAEAYLQDPQRQEKIRAAAAVSEVLPEALSLDLRAYAKETLLGEQQALLTRFGVFFEAWFSEEALHRQGKVQEAIEHLKAQGATYEEEGALWFKSSALGDEKDRVLVKSDGTFTYLTADIAYHDEKFSRKDPQGQPLYNRMINIWGADHHGYIARMRAAIQALGYDPNQFEVLLGQLVNLIVDGEKTRMGKRRSMLTLEDVIDEVGVDATRFWMVSKSADTALDFDVALAKSQSDENPVFYVQYAHARCASILRNAVQPHPNVQTGEMVQPLLSSAQLEAYQQGLTPQALDLLFSGLADEKGQETLRELILRLDGFGDLLQDAARLRAPHLVARYTLDLAADFHSFYNVCRILTPDPALTQARLMLIVALKKVLAQALDLLGVSAPESM